MLYSSLEDSSPAWGCICNIIIIMFPAHQSLGGYYYHDCFLSLGGLMAEGADDNIRCSEEATAKDINNNQDKDKDKEKEEDGGWLRLSLGSRIDLSPASGSNSTSSSSSSSRRPGDHIHEAALTTTPPPPPPPPPQQQLSFQFRGSIPITPAPPTLFLQPRRAQYHHHMINTSYLPSSSSLSVSPRCPAAAPSGLWFILQPSQTQIKEPYLPQLPKRYLRIKDGRTTVGLLIKYLVYKLQLDAEFEVEITCKGKQLLPFLSLQHVRDNIWNNTPGNEVVSSLASSIEHLMVLNYGRIASPITSN
ncbi:putative protein LAX PANICLE 2 [Helianthus debilis subsp. tardiflorus]